MKAAFHKYVSVSCNLGTGNRKYFLHVIERADGMNLFFATDFHGWPLDQSDTDVIAKHYKQGKFEDAEKELANCAANL
jgi:hypothetical protein